MAISKNAAFAGSHSWRGRTFAVTYFDLAALRRIYGPLPPPGAIHRPKVGWYVTIVGEPHEPTTSHGGYSSSRKAYNAALALLQGKVEEMADATA